MNLEKILGEIISLNIERMNEARARQDTLIKPLGSLGEIEELSVKLTGITGKVHNDFTKKAIVIMCADNGVYEEGVSPAPQNITLMQAENFQKGITGVGVLSKVSQSDMVVIDIGINSDAKSENYKDKKIRKGTRNLAKENAMTREEVLQAIEIGFNEVKELYENGYNVIGTGEMGLANTTTSSLVIMSLTGCDIDEAVGRGAGLDDETFIHKKNIIANAYKLHSPDKNDPIDVLSKVGGFDIAGLVGVYIGAAYYKLPVVIDGIISVAAALTAYKLCDNTREYMIPSHWSKEPGYLVAMNELNMNPYFNLGMRLGEGSGCPLSFLLIDMAQKVINDMATFEEVSMDNSKLVDIRE